MHFIDGLPGVRAFTCEQSIDILGGRYTGHVLNGKANGKGNLVWKNGTTYVGDFLNNTLHGKGERISPNGAKYTGDWEAGLRHGKVGGPKP